MSKDVIVAEQVGKCYHIYEKHIDRLKQALDFRERKHYREFWALRDISFSVKRGETVGIVGANGSGKSTLLQILFGVLQPTLGRVRIDGRVSGLLELGGGFNPEETGRENIRVNAAILGVPMNEIPELCEKIVAFAEIGDFLDQPVKVYSSGMSVRLAFAMQISIPCDVLIIDEALAVGDELFQRRCYVALENFRDQGGTVLFVSHSAASVKQLCRRAIFLDHGQLVQQGTCKIVIDNYQKFLYMREPQRSQFKEELMRGGEVSDEALPPGMRPGEIIADAPGGEFRPTTSEAAPIPQNLHRYPPSPDFEPALLSMTTTYYQPIGAVISNPRIESLDGRVVNILNPHERYRYCYHVEFQEPARHVVFGWLVKSTSGLELGGGAHGDFEAYLDVTGDAAYDVCFEFTASLFPGIYYLNCGVSGTVGDHSGFLHRVIDAVAFRVRNTYTRIYAGFADLDYHCSCKQAAKEDDAASEAALQVATTPT